MASHYKLYDGLNEVVPFNAKYSYPTQANRAWKQNIFIPTTNGQTFYPQSSNPQITFPAQGYLNTRNSFVSMEVGIELPSGATCKNVRFQNNIQSIFNRLQLRYGSLPFEDIRDSNVLTRMLTEATTTNVNGTMDQNAIFEGVGGYVTVPHNNLGAATTFDDLGTLETTAENPVLKTDLHLLNVRANFVQAANFQSTDNGVCEGVNSDIGGGQNTRYRRYQFQLPLGLFQQNKLIPLKWMSPQLTVEFTLANIEACLLADVDGLPAGSKYIIRNMGFNAEILEFDGSYDAAILEGLRREGLPIKFASWNTYQYTPAPGTAQTLQIPERNRSLKAAFCVQLGPASTANATDSHAMVMSSVDKSHLVDYQWRIGGKYYPAQPVKVGDGNCVNGGSEAYREFEKALNIVGDYRLSTSIHPGRWCPSGGSTCDYKGRSSRWDWPISNTAAQALIGSELGPSAFVIALDMETSGGAEVSGLNGEEQNDINLRITYSDNQKPDHQYYVFVYYDALLVLRENGLVEIVK